MAKNNPLKRTLTLDLNSAGPSTTKKARIQHLQQNHLLTSPDVQMLKLTSPELAEFLTRNPTLATPTPSGFIFPKNVTEEQELYAKGFEEALVKIHNSSSVTVSTAANNLPSTYMIVTTASEAIGNIPPATSSAVQVIENATAALRNKFATSQTASLPQAPVLSQPVVQNRVLPIITTTTAGSGSELSRPSSGASGSFDSSADSPFNQIHIKEERDQDYDSPVVSGGSRRGRQRTTSSPGASTSSMMSPINLENQEQIKLERKRMRNRMAASKCRKRKLERIAQLDSKVNDLKGENAELANVVKRLKDTVYNLKQEVLEHVKNGCQINLVDDAPYSAHLS